jgi:hypothetical protein
MPDKMVKYLKKHHSGKGERGEIVLIVLAFMLLGFLLIVPLVSYMGTGIKAGIVNDDKAGSLYSADAGVEDAMWQIKYDHLSGTFASAETPYDPFDYATPYWEYELPRVGNAPQVNDNDVAVRIKNEWMPKDITAPSADTAKAIVETGKSARFLVTGGPYGASSFNIVLTYTKAGSETLYIDKIGVWLPPGFTYHENCNMQGQSYLAGTSTYDYKGGQAIIWTLSYHTPITALPDVKTTDSPMTASITFDYTAAKSGSLPDGVAWAVTEGIDLDDDGVSTGTHFSWDFDVRVYGITSIARQGESELADTTVNTYVAKSEMRKMGGAVNGNYYATGASLMTGGSTRNGYTNGVATVPPASAAGDNNVPENANVAAAYLYWSAWSNEAATTRISPFNPDVCSAFTNWTNGGGWSVNPDLYFQGHYFGETESTRELTETGSMNLSAYSTSGWAVAASWEQWVRPAVTAMAPLNPDACGSFTNWTNGTAWAVSSSHFRGHSNTTMTNTLKNSIDLSSYANSAVTISWDSWVTYTPVSTDGLDFRLSADGTTFPESSLVHAFTGNIGGTATSPIHYSFTIPPGYCTSSFKIQFTLVGYSASNRYCYVDNISLNVPQPTYTASDGLGLYISKDNGVTWSNYISAFTGDRIGTAPFAPAAVYQYNIPAEYLTSQFRMKFYVKGCGEGGKYVNLDDIRITAMQPDTGITFKMKVGTIEKTVYFDSDGNPADGTGNQLVSTRNQVLLTYYNHSSTNEPPEPRGYAYSCYRDISGLVEKYATQPVDPATNYNGYATYTVVGDIGNTGDALSYAGWSLVLIYSSPDVEDHQLYLYEKFIYSSQETTSGLSVDWDGDGLAGGTVKGFIVPNRVQNDDGSWEVNAAKITCFVGEGDDGLSSDYFQLNGQKLWDGTTTATNTKASPNNCWNSRSVGLSLVGTDNGIDIDSPGIDPTANPPQYVTWDSNLIKPGDTEASLTLFTKSDGWFMVYMILSFRSETTTGGSLSYLIHG